MSQRTDEIVSKLRELLDEGNARRVRVKKDDRVLLNVSMTAGVAGAALGLMAFPWFTILAAAAAVGYDCTFEVEDREGNVKSFGGKRSAQ